MKRNQILFLVVLLAAASAILIWKRKTSISVQQGIHADSAQVQKLFFADMQGNTSTVVRKANGSWTLNNDMFARQDLVDHILYVLQEAEPSQQVPSSLRASVIKGLSVDGIKVEAYGKNDKLLSSFTIGGERPDSKGGTYALPQGSTDPHIYTMRTYDGNFATQFTADPQVWRSYTFINIPADSIAQVAVGYINAPDSSFIAVRKSDIAFDLLDNNNKPTSGFVSSRLKEYFNFFSDIRCLGFANNAPNAKDIIANERQYALIRITKTNGTALDYKLMYVKADQRAKQRLTIEGIEYNPEFLYCYDGKDLMMLNRENARRYLCMRSVFY
jgi:Domain of unknown function (DUF4340)